MKNSLKLLLIVIVQAISFFGFSQKGKHADYTVNSLDQIVNTYTSLTANAATGQTSIMVASNTMNGGAFSGVLEQGDLILIIQMQGASMDIDVTPTQSWGGAYTIPFGVTGDWHYAQDQWGRVLNYNNAGKFEKAEVKSIIGSNSIELSCPLQHNYSVSGHVQIVRIPRFNNLTVNTGASITAPGWNGTQGGIVAIEINNNLTLNGTAAINTTGKGFRGAAADNIGGSLDSNPSAFTGGIGSTFLASYLGVNGARKGEGIGGFTTEYAALSSEYSRSAPANGGGGGGIQNAGGGGGANVGVGTYTGKGVPSTVYPNSVWDLELAGFGGSMSSGGGRGGYALSSTDRNELTVGPNNSSWGGAGRKVEGGLGGHALNYDATRLFFGGGGGAGDQDNGQAGAGGHGGGISFLTVYGNILGDGSIIANGADGQKSNPLNQVPPNNSTQKKGNDGAGGAGGGGSVYIENINPIAATIKLKAIGGKGGDQALLLSNFAVSEAGGPGGGGAGGLICLGAGAPSVDVSGGLNGITTSAHMINFKANGATNGAQGFATNINNFFDLVAVPDTICSGQQGFPSVNVLGTLPGGSLVYWYATPTGGTALSAGNTYGTPPLTVTTTYYASVCPGTFRIPVEVVVLPVPATPTITASGPTTFCTGGNVTLTSSSATNNVWSTGATTQSITVSASGNYTVTVGTAGCTATSAPTTVTVNSASATPTISASGPTTFCSGGSVTLTSSSATDNVWSTGATTQAITVSTSGDYSVTVGTAGCSATSTITTVVVNPTPATPTISASGPTTFCSGGSVTLTSSSATNNVWSTGSTTQAITVSTAGDYSVTVGTAGCTATSTNTTVVVNPTPATPTITASGPTTFCSGGSVTLTSSSATDNVWSTGATTQAITVTAAGDYSVTVGTAGCTATSTNTTVVVNPTPATPTITASGPTTFCSGGSVTLTSSSASNNVWSTGATSQSITVSTAGDYSVTVGTAGCTATSTNTTVVVNSTPATPTISASGPTTFCSGGSVTLTSSSATDNVWSTGATTQAITVSTAGDYSVTVGTAGCTAMSTNTTVVVNPMPATPTISASGPTTFCSGGSVTLTSSSTTDNVWSTGENTQSITVTTSGDYTVTVGSGPCTSVSAITTVSVNSNPATPIITAGGPTTFCSGNNVVLSSSAASGNTWSTGETTQSITVTSSGDYSVTVGASGCSANSTTTTVTVNPSPATPTISASGPTTFCSGGSVTLTSSSATDNVWSTGENTQTITVTSSGDYSVTVGSGTCTSVSAITTVVVNPTPATPTISASGPTTFCSGGSVTLTSTSATDNVWSTGATTQAITVSTAGDYSVTVGTAGCTATSTITTVVVNPTPATPTISASGPTTFCSGGSVTLTSSSATDNVWSTGATMQAITVSTAGDYSVTVGTAGCTATSTITTVVVNPTPATPTITASGPTTFCSGGSITLTSSSATDNLWSSGETTQTITVTNSGDYTVTVGSGACTSVSAITSVSVNSNPATPTVSAGGPTTFCDGGNVVLTSSASSGNTWNTGETTQSITVTSSGDYSVTVGASGCSASSTTTTVTVNPVPATPVITANGPTTFCDGGNVVLSSSQSTGNSWSTGETTQSISVNSASNITLTYTENGCSASTNQNVNVNPNPLVTPSSNGPICENEDLNLDVNLTTGATYLWNGPSFSSNTPSTTINSATVANSGSYSIAVDLNGCIVTETIDVLVNQAPYTELSSNAPLCEGDDLSIGILPCQYDLCIWTGPSNFTSTAESVSINNINESAEGDYELELSLNGCSAFFNIYVDVNPIPIFTMNSNAPFCEGEDLLIEGVTPLGNFGPTTQFAWTGPQMFSSNTVSNIIPDVTKDHEGDYALTVTENGCSLTQVLNVQVKAMPTIVDQGPIIVCEGEDVNLLASDNTGANYLWTGPNNYMSMNQNPTLSNVDVTLSGLYQVHVEMNGCIDSNVVNVQVNGLPSVGATMNGGNCEGDDLLLFANGNGTSVYSWTGPNNFSSTEQNPVLSPVGPQNSGLYVVNVDENGCKSSSQIYVNVNAKPVVNFTVDKVSGCSPLQVVFRNNSLPADASVVWDFGNGINSINAISDSTIYTNTGCYDVSLTVTSNGCSETMTQNQVVCVTDSPIAEFTVNQTSASMQNPAFEFVNNSSFADNYTWDFGDNTIQTTTNASHLYEPVAGSYQVQLIASNVAGCTDTAYATVKVTDELIFYVPNAFTPNGDAYNNRFEPVFYSGYDPSSYTLYIFNRWGEIIFESHDVNEGWDGTFQGRMMQDDVYQWMILFEDSETDERYRFDGHVILLK